MPTDYRETELTIYNTPYVVRTERAGTVAQMEAAHTKAVMSAITNARRKSVDDFFTDSLSAINEDSERRRWHGHFMNGVQGPVPMPQAARMEDMVRGQIGKWRAGVKETHAKMSKAVVTKPVKFRVARKLVKPWPKVTYKPGDLSWVAGYGDQVEAS